MRKLPTDLQILDAIYEMYFDEYASFTDDGPSKRLSKVYVPLDIEKVAAKLATEGDIVFGRLYYVMDRKYAYKDDSDGSLVPFFAAHSLSRNFIASIFRTWLQCLPNSGRNIARHGKISSPPPCRRSRPSCPSSRPSGPPLPRSKWLQSSQPRLHPC